MADKFYVHISPDIAARLLDSIDTEKDGGAMIDVYAHLNDAITAVWNQGWRPDPVCIAQGDWSRCENHGSRWPDGTRSCDAIRPLVSLYDRMREDKDMAEAIDRHEEEIRKEQAELDSHNQ